MYIMTYKYTYIQWQMVSHYVFHNKQVRYHKGRIFSLLKFRYATQNRTKHYPWTLTLFYNKASTKNFSTTTKQCYTALFSNETTYSSTNKTMKTSSTCNTILSLTWFDNKHSTNTMSTTTHNLNTNMFFQTLMLYFHPRWKSAHQCFLQQITVFTNMSYTNKVLQPSQKSFHSHSITAYIFTSTITSTSNVSSITTSTNR